MASSTSISISFSFTLLLIVINYPIPSTSTLVEVHYADCAPSNSTCNSSQEISYPFWENPLKNYCGHPGFKLDCSSNSLTIQIVNETYNVLDVNYTSNVFTVVRRNFSQGACPRTRNDLTNSTLNSTLFNYTSSSETVALFYNCSTEPDARYPGKFPCLPNSYDDPDPEQFNSSVNFLAIDQRWKNKLWKICSVGIYLPVLTKNVIAFKDASLNVDGVVNGGAELTWVFDKKICKDCSNTGGRCGYNYTLAQPVCFCPDAISNQTCTLTYTTSNGKKTRKTDVLRVGVGVAVAVAVAGVFLLCILWVVYRRNKNNQSSETSEHLASRKIIPATFSATLDPNGSTYFGVKIFTYEELQNATDDFNPGKELGRGGFGIVYHGILEDGRRVAVKFAYENNNQRAEQFLNEVEILANLHHDHLVNLYGCTARESRQLLLVYEYVSNGTFADHLHGTKANLGLLPWPARLRIAIQTASALVYLHSSDVIHRDVKTLNILLNDDFSVKVADFGLSRLFPLDVTHVSTAPQGTPGYVDPEYHQYYQLTEKSDVYSFGVVLAELISSKRAVDITRRRPEINLSNMLITKFQNGALNEFVDPLLGFYSDDIKKEITAVADLAVQCIQSTREMRPSMAQVLERLNGIKNKTDTTNDGAEVLEISPDDVFGLKGDLSPTSPPRKDNTLRRLIPHSSA